MTGRLEPLRQCPFSSSANCDYEGTTSQLVAHYRSSHPVSLRGVEFSSVDSFEKTTASTASTPPPSTLFDPPLLWKNCWTSLVRSYYENIGGPELAQVFLKDRTQLSPEEVEAAREQLVVAFQPRAKRQRSAAKLGFGYRSYLESLNL